MLFHCHMVVKLSLHIKSELICKIKLVVHRYPIERQWDEQQMKVAILALFKDKNLTSFQYVMACYSRIIVPNIAMGEVYDARFVSI